MFINIVYCERYYGDKRSHFNFEQSENRQRKIGIGFTGIFVIQLFNVDIFIFVRISIRSKHVSHQHGMVVQFRFRFSS